MLNFALSRILWFIPNTIVLTFLLFAVMTRWVGSPAAMMLGRDASRQALEELNRAYGFDDPILVQYGRWLWSAMQGDFGRSYASRQRVTDMIVDALPITLELSFWAIFLAAVLAILLNSITTGRTWIALGVTLVSIIGITVPNFMMGTTLNYLIAIRLQWLPTAGWAEWSEGLWEHFTHLILPTITLSLFYFGSFSMVYRAEYRTILNQLFVRVAAAKGISESRVSLYHVMPNAALPIIAYIGISIGQLVGGAVVCETVFSLPGVGQVFVTAIRGNDFPVILAIGMMVLTAMMVFNLLADIVLAWVNPQVRLWK